MAVGFFWEQADADGSDEHPLERELALQLDVLARIRRLLEEALGDGREGHAAVLFRQQARVEEWVRTLRAALERSRARRGPGTAP